MPCETCQNNICICSQEPEFKKTRLVSRGKNLVRETENSTDFRILSWNIERLGDTGNLGRNKGIRPQNIINSIAKIIQTANPHICVLIEVFTQARGCYEVNRILAVLNDPDPVWQVAFSLGEGTGGLSNEDGSNRRGKEGYAMLYRSDLGITCVKSEWLKIYEEELYDVTKHGRSYIRDAAVFEIEITGDSNLMEEKGQDIKFPVAAFHAPGPRQDLHRQTQIANSIEGLFRRFSGVDGKALFANAFICADFNASEDADNLLEQRSEKNIDFSLAGNLDYMTRITRLVIRAYLVQGWLDENQKLPEISWPQKNVSFLIKLFESDYFKEVVLGNNLFALKFLENIVKQAVSWFVCHPAINKLTGIKIAEKKANDLLNIILEKRIKATRLNEDDFKSERSICKLWKSAIKAQTKEDFSQKYYEIEAVQPEVKAIIESYLLPEQKVSSWEDVRQLMLIAFNEEYEDQDLLASMNYTSYCNKIIKATLAQIRAMIRQESDLEIEERYENAFSHGVDLGFLESTTYDETLKTTRRKALLKTPFANFCNGKWSIDSFEYYDTASCSNYDQVLAKTDGVRFDKPSIEVVSVLHCVIPLKKSVSIEQNKPLLACAEWNFYLSQLSVDRMLVRVCCVAKQNLANLLKGITKPSYSQQINFTTEAVKGAWQDKVYCCPNQCITFEDCRGFASRQAQLSHSHLLSDHDGVLLHSTLYFWEQDEAVSADEEISLNTQFSGATSQRLSKDKGKQSKPDAVNPQEEDLINILANGHCVFQAVLTGENERSARLNGATISNLRVSVAEFIAKHLHQYSLPVIILDLFNSIIEFRREIGGDVEIKIDELLSILGNRIGPNLTKLFHAEYAELIKGNTVNFNNDDAIKAYIDDIAYSNMFGGELEIIALSSIIERHIYVDSNKICRPIGESGTPNTPIVLKYNGKDHYDLYKPNQGPEGR